MNRSAYLLPWLAGGLLASAMLFGTALASTGGTEAPRGSGGQAYGDQAAKPKCLWRKKFLSTTYGPPWNSVEGGPQTFMETPLTEGRHVVAVDPRVIPLGSKVRVWPNPHNYRGVFLAEDIGGAIKGKHVDIFVWQGPAVRDHWYNEATTVCLVARPDKTS